MAQRYDVFDAASQVHDPARERDAGFRRRHALCKPVSQRARKSFVFNSCSTICFQIPRLRNSITRLQKMDRQPKSTNHQPHPRSHHLPRRPRQRRRNLYLLQNGRTHCPPSSRPATSRNRTQSSLYKRCAHGQDRRMEQGRVDGAVETPVDAHDKAGVSVQV